MHTKELIIRLKQIADGFRWNDDPDTADILYEGINRLEEMEKAILLVREDKWFPAMQEKCRIAVYSITGEK